MKRVYKITLISFALLSIFVISTYIFLYNYTDYIFTQSLKKSSVPIDVVFVGAPKDFEVLPYSVKSVKKYLMQPINKLVLIAPKSEEAIKLANSLKMEYIDENTLLNHQEFINWINTNELKKNYGGSWNWYYQQFLKLLYYKISESKYYFIIDTDVVIKKPIVLVSNEGITTFFIGPNLGHDISKTSAQKLLGNDQYVPEFSFIADLMCFNKDIVKSMITKIETKFKTEFYKAGILVEQDTNARFSEYEMYGVYANYSSDIIPLKPLTNYIPELGHSRKRNMLFLDYYSLELKKYSYIPYNDYANQ